MMRSVCDNERKNKKKIRRKFYSLRQYYHFVSGRSGIIMKISSILSARNKKSRITIPETEDKHSVVRINNDDQAGLDVHLILDPLTKTAQKVAPFLMVSFNSHTNGVHTGG